ncbi:FGGY-family carbohydrate kinase [Demequina sediminicola]|uniref:FGGY-family carbohydrate kinase n=1 Tax=Demequina sediminicola TaxID=1095026 RepID=UPI000A91231A|nr:FGGY family carbohydrate kinase [Demequina sediminicola]
MKRPYLMGIDLGSTGVKVLVSDVNGNELVVEQAPTPWIHGADGAAELDGPTLLDTVIDLCRNVCDQLASQVAPQAPRIAAVGVTGMGESGLVVGADGTTHSRALAWFDPRGKLQLNAMPAPLAREFPGRTGLPLGVQVSVMKMLYLRDNGLDLRGRHWANLPEWVVARLGGCMASERSLASRTGLIDQDTGEPWAPMLAHLGVTPDFVPPLTTAGSSWGTVHGDGLPPAMEGAQLTVAGHDHLVAASAGGAIPADRYHVSMGTAEVILQVLDAPLSVAARDRLAHHFINHVTHVVPGQYVLVAGVKTGLLMRRALDLFDATGPEDRDALDQAVRRLPPGGSLPEGAVQVQGARNDDGMLSLVIRADGATSAEVFARILEHGNDEIHVLLQAMARETPPPTSTLMSGGWTRMESVTAARRRVLPHVTVSHRSQDTALGAALAAAPLEFAPLPRN